MESNWSTFVNSIIHLCNVTCADIMVVIRYLLATCGLKNWKNLLHIIIQVQPCVAWGKVLLFFRCKASTYACVASKVISRNTIRTHVMQRRSLMRASVVYKYHQFVGTHLLGCSSYLDVELAAKYTKLNNFCQSVRWLLNDESLSHALIYPAPLFSFSLQAS